VSDVAPTQNSGVKVVSTLPTCLPQRLQRNVNLSFLMNRYNIRDLFADERCSWAILDFLRSTKVGRRVDEDKDRKMKN
jgi:hypothetical protein